MRVAIIIPYSWSYWGGVIDHAEQQASALEALGVEVRIVAGYDPPSWRPPLRPQPRRLDPLPAHVLPLGRTTAVPTNGSISNIVIDPRAFFRFQRILERERFDLLHLHEPLVPIPPVLALATAKQPIVATFHAAGMLHWHKLASPVYGFLVDRIDCRVAVSASAERSADRYFPGRYHLLSNGTTLPPSAPAHGREQRVVFVGRSDPRKGLDVLLRAWPDIRRQTAATLRVIGPDASTIRRLLERHRVSCDGIETVGAIGNGQLTDELLRAKALVAPSVNGESFGMVITRAFACATPVVASNIDGYRDVVTTETGVLVPPSEPHALADALVALLADEDTRQTLGRAARQLAADRYSWDVIGPRLVRLYEDVLAGRDPDRAVTRSDRALECVPTPAREAMPARLDGRSIAGSDRTQPRAST